MGVTDRGPSLTDPQHVVELAEEIYKRKYQEHYERDHPGEFVAIDVVTGQAYVDKHPEVVIEQARKSCPDGVFHLIRIGAAGAFRVSYSSTAAHRWIF